MNMCKAVCVRVCESVRKSSSYKNDYKYCSFCEVWIKTNLIRCDCCKSKLRVDFHKKSVFKHL